MANKMTKCGTHDNMVTYEHVCDYISDLKNIPLEYSTLGSTAIDLRFIFAIAIKSGYHLVALVVMIAVAIVIVILLITLA